MQPEPVSHNDKKTKYYVKGSGTSACLLTQKLDDEPQFIQFCINGMEIINVELSGLFALAIVEEKCIENEIQGGNSHKNKRQLVKWGNLNEQLIHIPRIVQLKQYKPIKLISCGWNHALLRTQDGILLGFGENKYGQVGIHNGNKFLQEVVPVIENQSRFVNVIAAGFRQSYWTTNENQIFGGGQSKNNQLGKIIKKELLPETRLFLQPPTLNQDWSIVKIICGKKFVIILTEKGEVYGLGSNDYKCLASNQATSWDKFIKIGQNIQDIECGWSHLIFLDKEGVVRSRGRNNFGQLGRKDPLEQGRVEIEQKCSHIKVGTQFNFAKSQSGKLYGWGWNQHMNIFNKAQYSVIETPVPIDTPEGFQLNSCITYPAITIIKGRDNK